MSICRDAWHHMSWDMSETIYRARTPPSHRAHLLSVGKQHDSATWEDSLVTAYKTEDVLTIQLAVLLDNYEMSWNRTPATKEAHVGWIRKSCLAPTTNEKTWILSGRSQSTKASDYKATVWQRVKLLRRWLPALVQEGEMDMHRGTKPCAWHLLDRCLPSLPPFLSSFLVVLESRLRGFTHACEAEHTS